MMALRGNRDGHCVRRRRAPPADGMNVVQKHKIDALDDVVVHWNASKK